MQKTDQQWCLTIAPRQLGSRDLSAPNTKNQSLRRTRAGFSLIEVVLALGITSFSLLTILGLLPVGLNVLREAGEASTRARIIQKLHGEVLLMPFSALDARFGDQTLYYDDAGEPVAQTDATALYKVDTELTTPQYPISAQVTSGHDTSSSLKAIRLQFTKLHGDGRNPESSIIWIPNSGG
jgi:uncharacterized protein (TIGR02598 family)